MAILMYLIGCCALMAYNAIIIYRKIRNNKDMLKSTEKWVKSICQQLYKCGATMISPRHRKRLLKKLGRVEKLIAFSNALECFKIQYGNNLHDKYVSMLMQSEVFHAVAVEYGRKKNEERAYFAYFISRYPQLAQNEKGINANTVDTMFSYIEASDIYCRANVLKALCKVGDMHGIVNVLQLFSDKNNFLHHRLLAEDLFSFAGDREVLALHLWGKHKVWNNNIILGVVTFIAMSSDGFKDVFLPVLQIKSVGAEIRLAIIQYYKKYNYKPVQHVLIEYLNQTDNYELALEAASALSMYPGYSTTDALVSALQNENWHVRYAAASSLVALGEYSDGLIAELTNSDGDALQIVQYMLAHTSNEKKMNVSEVII